ncbi:MAG: hypothetical protein V3R95_06325 [Dehalococcoidia bacterium]
MHPKLSALFGATALAIFALAAVHVAAGTPPAEAQADPPARYYGSWGAGELVEAFANGTLCGATETATDGSWVLEISQTAPCAPSKGDVVTFKRQGKLVAASEVWSAGDVPDNVELGINDDLATASTPSDGTCGTRGPVATFGVSLQVTTGPCDAESLLDMLAGGCDTTSLWVTRDGAWVGFFVGSPSFVNAGFGALVADTPFLQVCAAS